jgi:hypothetical protein
MYFYPSSNLIYLPCQTPPTQSIKDFPTGLHTLPRYPILLSTQLEAWYRHATTDALPAHTRS